MKPEDIERIKDLLPTSLGSAEIREQIAADILRRSIVSARMENARYLAKIKEVATELSAGTINAAKARESLLNVLSQIGYDTTADDDRIANPVSERRLNLILETQREMAANAALVMSQNAGTIDQFPAWNLTRLAGRRFEDGRVKILDGERTIFDYRGEVDCGRERDGDVWPERLLCRRGGQ